MTITRDLHEINYLVLATASEYHCDFAVYHIEGRDVKDGSPVFTRSGAASTPDIVNTVDAAERFLHGFVKWDGCSNWHFDAQDEVMLHFCEKEEAENIGKLFAALYDMAKELLPTWND